MPPGSGSDPCHRLGPDEVEALVAQGKLMQPDSFDATHVRGAGYDLTMAVDLMVVPDRPNHATGRRYDRGEPRTRPVILMPGDAAFISSAERFCVPWNVAGTVGGKFGLLAHGLMLLTGLLLDPGYGLIREASGDWIAADDQRLHFLLLNIGSSAVPLTPGQTSVASVQFEWVPPVPEPRRRSTASGGAGVLVEQFFDQADPDSGLIFFRSIAELSGQVAAAERSVEAMRTAIDSFTHRMEAVERGSNQVVTFGIYLLSVTVFGVAFAVILNGLSGLKSALSWPNTIVLTAGILALTTLALVAMRVPAKLLSHDATGPPADNSESDAPAA